LKLELLLLGIFKNQFLYYFHAYLGYFLANCSNM